MRRVDLDVLVNDGAMGTMLQRQGVPAEQCPEELNVLEPEIVAEVHRLYALAGADCATTNSFGGSRAKLAEWGLADRVEEINRAAVRVARMGGSPHILADVGPTGLVLEPLGNATFDEVFDIFAEQIAALAAEAPDAILIETMTDIAEARCAVLAAKSVCELPVFASCTFGTGGRMDLSGTDPETAAIVLEAAGADAVGMNCGLGPEQMLPLVERMASVTALPVIVQPNAGLPTLGPEGTTVFPGTPDEMGQYAARFVAAGAWMVGSCCGSTPAFTGAIGDFARTVPLVDVAERAAARPSGLVVAGPRRVVRIGPDAPVALIGERINPTGKPVLADALREGSMSVVRTLAVEQEAAGADLLDVNVGAAGVDQVAALRSAILALVGTTDLPLVIDTTEADALEAALRVYPGKALINSVNGGAESLAAVLPLAARFGAAVVVLALDDDGIPEDVAGRVAIVARVREAAREAGIGDSDLLVDTLVLTAATDADAPRVTLDALAAVREMGLATMLGVSNVSHGLPERAALNAAFLNAAVARGLDAAIVNPVDPVVAESVRLARAALAAGVSPDAHGDAWAAWEAALASALERASAPGAASLQSAAGTPGAPAAPQEPAAISAALAEAVTRGDAEGAPALVDELIAAGFPAPSVIDDVLTPAIQALGDAFGTGEVFLPQLIVAAEAMKSAVARVKTYVPQDADSTEGRVVFATVKGDIHSIGKDICVSLLESRGFTVNDLGVDVPAERIVEAAAEADAVCLSALMTTTLRATEAAVAAVRSAHDSVAVLVGGAVVTAEWAESVGAGYADDAPGCVEAVRAAIASPAAGLTAPEDPGDDA